VARCGQALCVEGMSARRALLMLTLGLAASVLGLCPSAVRVRRPSLAYSPHVAAQRLLVMGRAERRMAKKRSKKVAGARSAAPASRGDVLPRTEVLARLAEVPVFGLKSGTEFLTAQDSCSCFYLDAREAERMCLKMGSNVRVEGLALSEIYFDPKTRLKAADSALSQLQSVPAGARLEPNIKVPLFCIDGLQTTDKSTGISYLPLFNSKAELLEFAVPVYGEEAAKRMVLATDLSVVVNNMINGPAGLLRNARFFADAKSLKWMDDEIARKKSSMFPDAPGSSDMIPPNLRGGNAGAPGGVFGGIQSLFPR